MKKKLALLLMCVIMCCAIVATTLVACTDDTWTFKVEGVVGYSDAIVDEANKTVSIVVQPTINTFDLNNIKVPAGLTYSVANGDKEPITGNMILLNPGDNTYYMTFKGEVEVSGKKYPVDVEWTIKIRRQTTDIKISSVEIETFETTYYVGESFKGGKLKLTYENETTVLIDIYQAMVTGFNTKVAGTRTVTIKYDDYTFERTINVISEDIGELEDITPTVITKIDSALDTFARLTAYCMTGQTKGDTFDSRKKEFLATLDDNKADMQSFLEYLGISDEDIVKMSAVADEIAPIIDKIYKVTDGSENYEILYSIETISEFQSIAKDALDIFSPSQLTLAVDKIMNWAISQQLINKDDYIEYTTPISDADIKAKVIAQFEMWTDGDYGDMPLKKNSIFAYIANAKNALNFYANIEPKKLSTVVGTIVKIATMDEPTPDNILKIGAKNLKDTVNYIGEIICGSDVSIINKTSMISYIEDIFYFMGSDEDSGTITNILIKSDLFDSKVFQIIGEVLMNFTADNVLEIVDLANVFITGHSENIQADYGNIIHYVGRMITPVIDKYYSLDEFNSLINKSCDAFADITNTLQNYQAINKNELKKSITDAYKLIYDASKKEELTTTEKAELFNGISEIISEIDTAYNPIYISNYYQTIVLPTNMTESDFYEYLNNNYRIGLEDVAFPGGMEIEFAPELCKGIDLTKAGKQTMTIAVDKYATSMKFYFVDDSNKGDFCFDMSGMTTPNNIRFALNSVPEKDQYYGYGRITLINRQNKINYTIEINNWSKVKFIGLDTSTTGHKKAIVEYSDLVFGAVYFPIDYIVYDLENPKIEREEIRTNDYFLGISDKLTGYKLTIYDSGKYYEEIIPDSVLSQLKTDAVGYYIDSVIYNKQTYTVYYNIFGTADFFAQKMHVREYEIAIGTSEDELVLVFEINKNQATLAEINAWLADKNLGRIYLENFITSAPGYYHSDIFFEYTDGRTEHINSFSYEAIYNYEYDIANFNRTIEITENGHKSFNSNILTETDIINLKNGKYDDFEFSFYIDVDGYNRYMRLSLTELMSLISEKHGNARIDIIDNVLYLFANDKVVGAREFYFISDMDALKPIEYRVEDRYFHVALGGTIDAIGINIVYGNNEIVYATEIYPELITPEQISGIDFYQIGTQQGTVSIRGIKYNITVEVYPIN